MNDYSENISNEISISVAGEGFVSADKKVGNEDNTTTMPILMKRAQGI